jgi:predicted phosphodiesterase
VNIKVLIFGDSHAKKCALELRHKLEHKYEVRGFIKPGAVTRKIVRTAGKEVSTLKQEDVVILWAGANDISTNNSKKSFKKCILLHEC